MRLLEWHPVRVIQRSRFEKLEELQRIPTNPLNGSQQKSFQREFCHSAKQSASLNHIAVRILELVERYLEEMVELRETL